MSHEGVVGPIAVIILVIVTAVAVVKCDSARTATREAAKPRCLEQHEVATGAWVCTMPWGERCDRYAPEKATICDRYESEAAK